MQTVNSILIVDDNNSDVFITSYYLQETGKVEHIWSASDGEEALKHFEEHVAGMVDDLGYFPPTAVILDINMPRMNGFDFVDEIAKLDYIETLPLLIVMLSSSHQDRDIAKAEANPLIADYFFKPFGDEHIERLWALLDIEANGSN